MRASENGPFNINSYLMILLGTPTAVALLGILLITAEPALIIVFPMTLPWIMLLPIPTNEQMPMDTPPAKCAPGQIWTPAATLQS